jgi:hypothetical protein
MRSILVLLVVAGILLIALFAGHQLTTPPDATPLNLDELQIREDAVRERRNIDAQKQPPNPDFVKRLKEDLAKQEADRK